MDQKTFDGLIRYSLSQRGSRFWGAFIQGLRWQFYGCSYGSPAYHEGWLALGPEFKLERAGYLAGLNYQGGR